MECGGGGCGIGFKFAFERGWGGGDARVAGMDRELGGIPVLFAHRPLPPFWQANQMLCFDSKFMSH